MDELKDKKGESNSFNTTMLAGEVADLHKIPRSQALLILSSAFAIIGNKLANGMSVRVHSFGNFKPISTKARMGKNLQTGESKEILASTRPHFTAAANLKIKVKDHTTEDVALSLNISTATASPSKKTAEKAAKPPKAVAGEAPRQRRAVTEAPKTLAPKGQDEL